MAVSAKGLLARIEKLEHAYAPISDADKQLIELVDYRDGEIIGFQPVGGGSLLERAPTENEDAFRARVKAKMAGKLGVFEQVRGTLPAVS